METGNKESFIELIDRSLEGTDPKICHLSILLRKDGLSFSLIRKDLKKVILLGHHPGHDLPELLRELADQITEPYGSVSVSLLTDQFFLTPQSLSGDEPMKVIRQVLKNANGTKELEGEDLLIGYEDPLELKETVRSLFGPETLFAPQAYFSIGHWLSQSKYKPGFSVYASWFHGQLEMLAGDGGKLLFYNIFPVIESSDAGYFILNAFEQLGINPHKYGITLGGPSANQAFEDFLKQYIHQVEWLDSFNGIQFSPEITKPQRRAFAPLFLQFSCVL
ncbi:MAG: DUF3822 family protein [Bacteroidota bacterium]|nr:DUF3822 family protein [Bacteroidota bacterium]MDX5447946.1 DUF3822 family protein [Bacteroidota bacterium]